MWIILKLAEDKKSTELREFKPLCGVTMADPDIAYAIVRDFLAPICGV